MSNQSLQVRRESALCATGALYPGSDLAKRYDVLWAGGLLMSFPGADVGAEVT